MSSGPKKILLSDVAISALWWLISGFIWSIIIILVVFMASSFLSVPWTFEQARLVWGSTNSLFPFIFSFITLIASTITLLLWAKVLHMIDSQRYKSNSIIYWQLGFFALITYISMIPIYIYTGLISYDYIMIIFIIHVITLAFWSSILLEIMNNYRYILLGFYGSFIGLLFTCIIVVVLFNSIESGQAKLLSLLIIIPLVNTSIIFFKWLFELVYYHYHKFTNLDGLWDIFYAVEQEEKELLREEEQKNNL